MDILKISAAALCAVISGLVLKSVKSPLAVMVPLATSVVILFYIVSGLMTLISQLSDLKEYLKWGQGYIGLLLKIMGITYITQLSADICRDNGYQAVAGQIEIFSKLTIAVMSMPVVLSLFEMVTECIN